MNQDIDIEIVRSIMFEPGAPNPAARDGARARFIANADSPMALRPRRVAWLRRKIRIAGIGVPVGALGVLSTAAATAAVTLSATSLFQLNPQISLDGHGNGIETVVPSSVAQVATTAIPDYGTVEFWAASTSQNGFCFALKLPAGTWAGYAHGDASVSADGFSGGVVPGCVEPNQQQIVEHSAAQSIAPPRSLEVQYDVVRNDSGKFWDIYFGYVTADGTAATVRDPLTGTTTDITNDGYYALAVPEHGQPGPPPNTTLCGGCDADYLQVLNSAGQELQPDYTAGKLLPGYSLGPSAGQTP